jgi:hypothetical protein
MIMGVGAVLAGVLVLKSLTSTRHHGRHDSAHNGRHNGRHDVNRSGWLESVKDARDELSKAARKTAREAAKQGDRLLASSGRAARSRAARADA